MGSDALRPLFPNLVSNAVKHGGESVHVRMSGSVDGGTASVHVADTVVCRLDGDVRFEESEWGGAEFVVTLPAADRLTPRPRRSAPC